MYDKSLACILSLWEVNFYVYGNAFIIYVSLPAIYVKVSSIYGK